MNRKVRVRRQESRTVGLYIGRVCRSRGNDIREDIEEDNWV